MYSYQERLALLNRVVKIFMGNTFRILSSILVGVVVAWTVDFVLANLLQCIPISANWTSWTGDGCFVNLWQLYLAQAWSDVLTDRK